MSQRTLRQSDHVIRAQRTKGGGDNTNATGCSSVAGRNNKQPTNSFNKQIPVGISHEAEGPQLECSQGPAVVH